jgi:hypothetical protein
MLSCGKRWVMDPRAEFGNRIETLTAERDKASAEARAAAERADSMVADLQVAACDLRAERDEARERWTDLRGRLQRAESVLTQNGKYDTGMRLQGKAQGVALALSYMGDAERIAASQSANPDPPTGVANPTGAERRGSRRPRWDPTAHVWLALSIARLDALIAEWRAAADDFASRND